MGDVAVRSVSLMAACLCAGASSAAPDLDSQAGHHLAFGVRIGFVPPVLAVAEVLARPVPHLALGVFGMAVSRQSSGGAEVIVEPGSRSSSTPYIQLAYLYYYSDEGPRQERSQLLYATAGYTWKSTHGELQLGGGLLFSLSDKMAPCAPRTFICIGNVLPAVLPTIDLGFRFAPF